MEGIPAVWNEDGIDWSRFDLVVLRSTWDYAERRDDFLRWVDTLPRVLNAAEVVHWNTDKRYLGELARRGVPVVSTTFVEPGEAFAAPDDRFVVKPTISAGGRRAASYSPGDERAVEHVHALHAAGDTAMVQRYLEEIDQAGETELLYVGGRYSHSIRKAALLMEEGPRAEVLYLAETINPNEPSAAEREAADRALAATPFDPKELLYARVDVILTAAGPVVLEVELTEPSLYLGYGERSASRLAEAITRAVAG